MALIAAQLYTLRDYCKDFAGIAESCRKVKKMGYDGIQISGVGPFDPQDMAKLLADEGLACATTHYSIDKLENEFDTMVANHKSWGCNNLAIGGFFPPAAEWTLKSMNDYIARFNALAQRLAKEGMTLGYHNHNHEFARLNDSNICPYELFIREFDPECTWFEIDTHWVQRGGASPSALIRRLPFRIPCIHFKDVITTTAWDNSEYKVAYGMGEVGDGMLDWPGIVEACKYAGVRWYIVERDQGTVPPFESLQRSIDNMRNKMGL